MNRRRGSVNSIDILICVCILIILAAILFPMLARSGGGVNKSTCQFHLKEYAVALQLYRNDYNGHLPSSVLVNHSKKWNRQDFLTFATNSGSLPPKPGQRLRTLPEILDRYIRDKDVMWCPSDPASETNPKGPISYWYKLAIDKAWYGDGGVKPCRKESDFACQADQIALYERKSFHCVKQVGLFDKQIPPLINGTMINVAYLDSHIKTITLANATSGDPNNCAANMDGEPMYFNADGMTGKKIPAGVSAGYIDPGRFVDDL